MVGGHVVHHVTPLSAFALPLLLDERRHLIKGRGSQSVGLPMSRLETSQSGHPLGMAPSVGKGRGQGGLGADGSQHRPPGKGQKGYRAEGDGADRI